jgi:hypothetical protein
MPNHTVAGPLSTLYVTTNMFGSKRNVWKQRYFILNGNVLYRFKNEDTSLTVSEMMKLIPASVTCVSNQFPGKQWCIEVAGAVSIVPDKEELAQAISNGTVALSQAADSRKAGLPDAKQKGLASISGKDIIWQAITWYVQAADGDGLNNWLQALKHAVVRAKYAIRALPEPPNTPAKDNPEDGESDVYTHGRSNSNTHRRQSDQMLLNEKRETERHTKTQSLYVGPKLEEGIPPAPGGPPNAELPPIPSTQKTPVLDAKDMYPRVSLGRDEEEAEDWRRAALLGSSASSQGSGTIITTTAAAFMDRPFVQIRRGSMGSRGASPLGLETVKEQ